MTRLKSTLGKGKTIILNNIIKPENTRTSALQKRIRRHIIARNHQFLIITTPGMETVCLEELKALKLPLTEIIFVKGGVEFTGRLHHCYEVNFKLRTANRILMRIGLFKATNFRQLDRKLEKFPWNLYLSLNLPVDLRISVKHSRLRHTQAIAEIFGNHIPLWQKHNDPPPKFLQTLFIRIIDDRFQLSLDSSGDLLYKRGFKKHGGKAPLRETIAAAILRLCGDRADIPLIDPMCGSGTFSLESALMRLQIAPGIHRQFAFMAWPAFRSGQWRNIIKSQKQMMPRKASPPAVIFAFDKDDEACKALRITAQNYGLDTIVNVARQDFFCVSPHQLTSTPGIITINPPYGRRLGSLQHTRSLFRSICLHLKKNYHGWRFALIVPHSQWLKGISLQSKSYHFHHGGQQLILLTGKID